MLFIWSLEAIQAGWTRAERRYKDAEAFRNASLGDELKDEQFLARKDFDNIQKLIVILGFC